MWYYLCIISAFAVFLCVYDKFAAKARKYRVRESFLYLVSFMGGALAMYVCMLLVRHKTKRLGFMVALPVMAIGHIALFIAYGKGCNYWM